MHGSAKFSALTLAATLALTFGAAGPAAAQAAPPVRVGDLFRPSAPPAGWTYLGYGCKETFTVCAHALRRGAAFLVVQTRPVNHRPGQPLLSERVVRVTPYAARAGETTGWNCYIDEQWPLLVFVPPHRRSARAIVLDKADNYVEVERRLTQPNWCEFDVVD
ncbi:MAG: hypothetical protein ACK4YQ_10180 [Phenylobacterium sp.]|uniref:hypothetical protein n=1 Tax=Phenylobacterium sp. TaxID=1871053 RepID=UPI00391BE20F